MSHQPPEPRSQPAPDTRSTKCRGCGFFIDACHCAGAEFRVGDIIVRQDNPDGPRYRVEQAAPGWFAAHRIRQRRPHRPARVRLLGQPQLVSNPRPPVRDDRRGPRARAGRRGLTDAPARDAPRAGSRTPAGRAAPEEGPHHARTPRAHLARLAGWDHSPTSSRPTKPISRPWTMPPAVPMKRTGRLPWFRGDGCRSCRSVQYRLSAVGLGPTTDFPRWVLPTFRGGFGPELPTFRGGFTDFPRWVQGRKWPYHWTCGFLTPKNCERKN